MSLVGLQAQHALLAVSVCVAEGGELCLTSGDWKEPEDIDVYNKNLFLSLGKAEREEEEKEEEEDAVFLGFLSVTRG